MPSRESVPEEVRARTEFVAAVRTGIDALMGRCGYSRERAVNALLKEINRGHDSGSAWGKPTDDEVFDAMRKHKLNMDDANRALVVSRATRREMLSRKGTTPSEAIDRLIAKISLDNILYESGEDDSDDEQQQNEAMAPLKIPRINRVSSSSSITPSSSSSPSIPNNKNTNNNKTCSNTSHPTRKSARNKKLTSPSPRKLQKTNHNSGTGSSSSSTSTILVGKKRSIEDLDESTSAAVVETKAATVRPHRASKRLHRATTTSTTEPTVSGANK